MRGLHWKEAPLSLGEGCSMPGVQCCELRLGWIPASMGPFTRCSQQCTTCALVPDLLITSWLTQDKGRPILCLENENKGLMASLWSEDGEGEWDGESSRDLP